MSVTIGSFLESYSEVTEKSGLLLGDENYSSLVDSVTNIVKGYLALQCFTEEELIRCKLINLPIDKKVEKSTLVNILEEFNENFEENEIMFKFSLLLETEFESETLINILDIMDNENWEDDLKDYLYKNNVISKLDHESCLHKIILKLLENNEDEGIYDLMIDEINSQGLEIDDDFIYEEMEGLKKFTQKFRLLLLSTMNQTGFFYVDTNSEGLNH